MFKALPLLTTLLTLLPFITTASPFPDTLSLTPRSGKPTGGPAIMTLNIYGQGTCPPNNGAIDPSLKPVKSLSLAEKTCVITPFLTGTIFSAVLTQGAKTGTAGCYAQLYVQSGCGLTLVNSYYGYAFDGVDAGATLPCGAPFGQAYGAVEIVCA